MQQLVLFFHEWIISFFHRSFVFGVDKCTLRRVKAQEAEDEERIIPGCKNAELESS